MKHISGRFCELQIRSDDAFLYILILDSITEHQIWTNRITQRKAEAVERKRVATQLHTKGKSREHFCQTNFTFG